MSAETQQAVACLRDGGGEHGETCRSPSCHSRLNVREVITRNGSVTLCRPCRKQYFGVTS